MQMETEAFLTWHAGEVAPAGTYARIDDQSYRLVQHKLKGPLPASFDGHVAVYCACSRVILPVRAVERLSQSRS
ncbi:MAG TPA: hypothetical protein VL485_07970 [Ktedonobacteraceae bacterium]|nr:hypothetical protein [Ktedonobacteraceae bacterium]